LPALAKHYSDEHSGKTPEEQEVTERLYQKFSLDKYWGI